MVEDDGRFPYFPTYCLGVATVSEKWQFWQDCCIDFVNSYLYDIKFQPIRFNR